MTNWNTRLGLKFIGVDGTEFPISPIDSFSPSIDTPHDVINSIDQENVGYSRKNRSFTFDFTVKAANVEVMREMFAAALSGGRFDIGLFNTDSENHDDWVFDEMKFENCRFTSVNPSEVDNEGGIPTMTFSGICLNIRANNLGSNIISTDN